MVATAVAILASIMVAASLTLALKFLDFIWFRPKKLEKFLRNQGLDGSPYRPFLGDLRDYIGVAKQERTRSIDISNHEFLPHVFAYYHRILSKHGENSFLWLGPYPCLNITDPKLMKEILRDPQVYQKPFPERGKLLAGGLLYLEGEKWAKHRKIVNPAFQLDKLKNMVQAMYTSCSSMIQKMETMVSSSDEGRCDMDIKPYLLDLTGDVISRTAFGSSYEEGRRIFKLQSDRADLTHQLMQWSFIPGWRYLPTKVNKKIKAMTKEIECLVRGIVERRVKSMERGEAIGDHDDLLGILLETNSRLIEEEGSKNAGMSIEEVIEECILFYFAGSETTAGFLVWTMVLLSRHPEWQTRAREEVIAVFGNSEPTYEALNRLNVVSMILQEVLRLYPSAPITERCTTQTVKLGNLTIPAGVHLTLLLGLLHYDPQIWGDDAREFKPERFSQGAAKMGSAYIPFGSGPRVCIGQNFSMIEAKMAIASILQRFSFELSPSYVHAPFSIVTLQPQYGAPLIFHSLQPTTK